MNGSRIRYYCLSHGLILPQINEFCTMALAAFLTRTLSPFYGPFPSFQQTNIVPVSRRIPCGWNFV
jgi:hypothetical protein